MEPTRSTHQLCHSHRPGRSNVAFPSTILHTSTLALQCSHYSSWKHHSFPCLLLSALPNPVCATSQTTQSPRPSPTLALLELPHSKPTPPDGVDISSMASLCEYLCFFLPLDRGRCDDTGVVAGRCYSQYIFAQMTAPNAAPTQKNAWIILMYR